MLAYGGDRVRTAGGKVILHSAISKGWAARKPKDNVHAEYPGTAVLWDEQYFEVITAQLLPQGGVRYVLEPWRDEHVIRQFDQYDAATEARRIEDYRQAIAQQKKSAGARVTGIVLGLLPAHVQKQLENDLGVSPARMTLLSCLLPLALVGICVWLYVDAKMKMQSSGVPFWLWLAALAWFAEAVARFIVAMSQQRGMGSMVGFLLYIPFYFVIADRKKWPSPFDAEKGHKLFTLPPPDDVALRDELETRGPLITLLPASDQQRLADRFGFDYRRHAFGLTWIILVATTFGTISSLVKVADSGSVSALTSLIVAGAIAAEQVYRLAILKRGPAGSFLGVFARPFVRRLLERA
jgi:hypothetical protein